MKTESRSLILALLILMGMASLGHAAGSGALQEKLLELKAVASQDEARKIVFSEQRFFPFRKAPVELQGVLRMWDGRGLSISYPEKRIGIIADEAGVLLRKYSKDEGFRQKSGGASESDSIDLLRAAFAFDVEVLEEAFEMEWAEDRDGWAITMTPRDPEMGKIERLVISGSEASVKTIEMVFGSDRRIEIHPLEESGLSGFSAEEERLYFRELEEA